MQDLKFGSLKLPFKVNQIICLEDRNTCLYGEVIQLIPSRKICWFRPICMTIDNLDRDSGIQNRQLIHLQSGSDLLWPVSLFRAALDTEVIFLLGELDSLEKSIEDRLSCRQHLNQFIHQVWQNNQDKF